MVLYRRCSSSQRECNIDQEPRNERTCSRAWQHVVDPEQMVLNLLQQSGLSSLLTNTFLPEPKHKRTKCRGPRVAGQAVTKVISVHVHARQIEVNCLNMATHSLDRLERRSAKRRAADKIASLIEESMTEMGLSEEEKNARVQKFATRANAAPAK